jgi:microcompartment protein CcmK/EutM
MTLGRVIGRVWASVKHSGLEGLRLLVVQPLTAELAPTGRRIVCTDCTGAGAGELVYWVRGKEASFPFLPAEPPTDNTIVGIVDSVHVASRVAGGQGAPAGAAEPGIPAGAAERRGSRRKVRPPC